MKKKQILSLALILLVCNISFSQKSTFENLYEKFPEKYKDYQFSGYYVAKDFTNILWSLKLDYGKYIYDIKDYSNRYFLISINRNNMDTIRISNNENKTKGIFVYQNHKLKNNIIYNGDYELESKSTFSYLPNKEIQIEHYSGSNQIDSIVTYLENDLPIRAEKFIDNKLNEEYSFKNNKIVRTKHYRDANTYEIIEYVTDDDIIKKYFEKNKLKVYEKLNLHISSTDNPQKINVLIEYDDNGKEFRKTFSEYGKKTIITTNAKIVKIEKEDGSTDVTEYNSKGKLIKSYTEAYIQTVNPETKE